MTEFLRTLSILKLTVGTDRELRILKFLSRNRLTLHSFQMFGFGHYPPLGRSIGAVHLHAIVPTLFVGCLCALQGSSSVSGYAAMARYLKNFDFFVSLTFSLPNVQPSKLLLLHPLRCLIFCLVAPSADWLSLIHNVTLCPQHSFFVHVFCHIIVRADHVELAVVHLLV